MQRSVLCVMCMVAAVIAQGCGEARDQPILHPQAAYIAGDGVPSESLDLTRKSQAADLVDRASPESGPLIGELESPAEEVFGSIEGALLIDGEVILLDGSNALVSVFTTSGEFLQAFGGSGRGPGQFASPSAIAGDSDGKVYIGDLARRVQVFGRSNGSFGLDTTLSTGVSPLSMCILGDNLVVHGVNLGDSTLIRTFGLDGEPRAAFGAIYKSSSAIINHTLSKGQIACDVATQTIAYAPNGGIGEIRGYGLDGRVRWRVALQGYRPIRVLQYPDEGFGVQEPPEGYHRIERLTSLPDSSFRLQVAFINAEADSLGLTYNDLWSATIDARTGRLLKQEAGHGVLLVQGAEWGARLLPDPFHRVQLSRSGSPSSLVPR